MIWTEELDSELRRLVAGKLTAKQIAEVMGITKNSVCGRVHRQGLPIVWQPKGPRTDAGRVRKSRARSKKPASMTLEEIFPELREPAPPPAEPAQPASDYGHVHLLNLKDSQCHFIEGEASGGYCGRPVTSISRPYCKDHQARMYAPRKH